MRDDLASSLVPAQGETFDPVELARRDQKRALPKRFYKQARVEAEGKEERKGKGEGEPFALVLDGKRARTPARNTLAVPSRELAQALAAEWNAQEEYIDPGNMPLTRLINSAIDGVAREMAATAAEIVKYAGSDLLCYRAGDPEALSREQSEAWDPVLTWLHAHCGARLSLAGGIVFVEQPPPSLAAFAGALDAAIGTGPAAPFRAAALNVVTTLTGSAILALALASGRLSADQAWTAAHVDEDFQMRAWGQDSEAMARRARRWREMAVAALVLEKLRAL